MQFLFADHTLETHRRELRRGDEFIDVEPQVLDLLIDWVANRDRVVSKDDLIASVWEGRIRSGMQPEQSGLDLLREGARIHRPWKKPIPTIPGKGHRFIGAVRTHSTAYERRTPTSIAFGSTPPAVAARAAAARPSRHCSVAVRQHE